MKELNYKFEGMTMAITDMEQMLIFYAEVFDIQFEEQAMYGTKLYSSTWGGLQLLFCPAAIARNTAQQNRIQFDIVVEDIHAIIDLAIQHGGKAMGEISEGQLAWSIGIYDPDHNSMVFKQYK